MKLAFTVGTGQENAELVRRFGRCAYFIIVDTESGECQALPNPAVEARGGAGSLAAQFLADQGVEAVVSGDFGPNAFAALNLADIRMYSADEGTVNQLVDDFLADRLKRVSTSSPSPGRGGRRRHAGRGQ